MPIAGEPLRILRPPDAEALLTEEAFDREQLLPYWAELWSSGIALADELAGRALSGRRTLELGCGLGLVSIAAARAGARVTATDWSEEAVATTRANAARNEVELETLVCDWRDPEPLLRAAPWPLVLCSDVLYEQPKVDEMLELLPRLVNGSGEVLLADPGRQPAERFLAAAGERFDVRSRASARVARVTVHRLRLR